MRRNCEKINENLKTELAKLERKVKAYKEENDQGREALLKQYQKDVLNFKNISVKEVLSI